MADYVALGQAIKDEWPEATHVRGYRVKRSRGSNPIPLPEQTTFAKTEKTPEFEQLGKELGELGQQNIAERREIAAAERRQQEVMDPEAMDRINAEAERIRTSDPERIRRLQAELFRRAPSGAPGGPPLPGMGRYDRALAEGRLTPQEHQGFQQAIRDLPPGVTVEPWQEEQAYHSRGLPTEQDLRARGLQSRNPNVGHD